MSRLGQILNRDKQEAQLDSELRFHFDTLVAEKISAGMSEQEAKRTARLEFGGLEQVKEECRDARATQWLENRLRDLRIALRQMRRNPGFTAAAVLTLAVGLGATTAIFTVVDGVLLRPLQFPEPDRLVLAQTSQFARIFPYGPVNARHFSEWRAHCTSCEQVALASQAGATLLVGETPERVPGLEVSSNFFRTLGVRPRWGRDFLPGEELPGNDHVAILSDSLWRTHFAADRSIIGRRIMVNGEPSEVIGVMPPTFYLHWGSFFPSKSTPEFFKPLGLAVSGMPGIGSFNYLSVARLKPGATIAAAATELNALVADYVHQRGFNLEIKATPLMEGVTGTSRSGLWLLFAIVSAVLLIACVNVGNLVLVRTIARQREAGIRLALGSSSAALIRLVLEEVLLLVLAGGVLGLLFAYTAVHLFQVAVPIDLPRLDELEINGRVLLFAAGAILGSTLISASVPAYRLSRIAPQGSLQSESTKSTETASRLRIREIMVGAEVALSAVLLIVGGLLTVSFFRLMKVDTGLAADNVISQGTSLISPSYRDDASRNRFIEEALRQISAIPGVDSAGVVSQLPLTGENWRSAIFNPDSETGVSEATAANFRFVNPAYRATMGIPLLQGRFIEDSDRDRHVGVISERTARRFWPNQDPIGKQLRVASLREPAFEVVGVVGNVLAAGPGTQPPLTVYQPYWAIGMAGPTFVLRTRTDPHSVAGTMRAALRNVDRDVPLMEAKTMEEVAGETVQGRKFQVRLAASFALTAMALASFGVYGVISFTVARRTRELGIRIALGARARQILAMVMAQGMLPVVAGLVAGIGGALLIGNLLAGELYGITPRDPLTITSVVLLLLAVAFFACYLPARRVVRINPAEALRWE